MLSLLRSDLYRLAHGKALWVSIAILALAIGFMFWAIQAVASTNATNSENLGAPITAIGNMVQVNGDITRLFGSVLLSTGVLALICCVLAALLLASDFETGYIRNIWSVRSVRRTYLAEKLVLCALVSVLFAALSMLFTFIDALALDYILVPVKNADILWEWIGLTWLAMVAYLFLTATVTLLAQSRGAGLAAAIVFSTGFLDSLISYPCALLAPLIPPVAGIPDWLLSNSIDKLAEGSGTIVVVAGHLVPAAIVAIVASVVLTMVFAGRRDV